MMRNVLILTVLFSLIIKIQLHIYLDVKHKRFIGFKPANMQPIEYFLPYILDVQIRYKALKVICNITYCVMIATIIFTFIYSFLTGTKLS